MSMTMLEWFVKRIPELKTRPFRFISRHMPTFTYQEMEVKAQIYFADTKELYEYRLPLYNDEVHKTKVAINDGKESRPTEG